MNPRTGKWWCNIFIAYIFKKGLTLSFVTQKSKERLLNITFNSTLFHFISIKYQFLYVVFPTPFFQN